MKDNMAKFLLFENTSPGITAKTQRSCFTCSYVLCCRRLHIVCIMMQKEWLQPSLKTPAKIPVASCSSLQIRVSPWRPWSSNFIRRNPKNGVLLVLITSTTSAKNSGIQQAQGTGSTWTCSMMFSLVTNLSCLSDTASNKCVRMVETSVATVLPADVRNAYKTDFDEKDVIALGQNNDSNVKIYVVTTSKISQLVRSVLHSDTTSTYSELPFSYEIARSYPARSEHIFEVVFL